MSSDYVHSAEVSPVIRAIVI